MLGLDPFDQWFFSSGAGDDQRFGQVAITGIFCADGLKWTSRKKVFSITTLDGDRSLQANLREQTTMSAFVSLFGWREATFGNTAALGG